MLVIVALLWKELLYATFDPLGAAASGIRVGRLEYLFLALVALTIVVSLQAVGIILVVAMLVTPAATAQMLTARFTRLMVVAALIGIASSVLGLYLSYWLDVASGATIVLVQTGLFVIALVLGPRGMLGRRRSGRGRRGRAGRSLGGGMTAPREAATHAANHLVEALDRAGHRLTGPRLAVAELVARRDGHFTAADLVTDARRSAPRDRTGDHLPRAGPVRVPGAGRAR